MHSNYKYCGDFTYVFPHVDSSSRSKTGFQSRITNCRTIAHFLKPHRGSHQFVEIQTEIYM